MVVLNDKAVLIIENEIEGDIIYQSGYIHYTDGFVLPLGRVYGNFLYDKNYVYKWSINKAYPDIYDINDRCEVIDINHELTSKLFKLIKK